MFQFQYSSWGFLCIFEFKGRGVERSASVTNDRESIFFKKEAGRYMRHACFPVTCFMG
jgi:hypothetical protein